MGRAILDSAFVTAMVSLIPKLIGLFREVAVAAFLNERIDFPAIAAAIADALDRWSGGAVPSVEDVFEADLWARRTAQTFIDGHVHC